MRKAISTYVHIRERLHPGILDNFARSGAQAVEVFAARGHFDYSSQQHIREIGSWFNGNSTVEFHSMHSPMYADEQWGRNEFPLNIADRERKGRIAAMDEIKRAIEVAERVPFRYLVQHVGVGNEKFDNYKFEAALSSIEHLRAFAKPLNVRLLLENIPNELSTPDRLLELIQVGHFDDVGICLDLGHAHLEESVQVTFERLRGHIRSTHVHDNDRGRDAHLWPGEGTIDWKLAMDLLREAPQVPPVLLEIEGDPDGNPEFGRKLPELAQKTWEKLGL